MIEVTYTRNSEIVINDLIPGRCIRIYSALEVSWTKGWVAQWLEQLAYVLRQWGDLGSNPGLAISVSIAEGCGPFVPQ